MSDLVERLREMRPDFIKESAAIMQEAADRIEKLEAELGGTRRCWDDESEISQRRWKRIAKLEAVHEAAK